MKNTSKGDSKMLIKKILIFLPLFLFVIYSPTYALEMTSTFRIVNDKNETIASKEVSFQEGETLYEVTKKAFNIEESQGNIISINGIHSIPKKNIHWAVFVNRNFIELGLDEVTLNENDDVVWALKNWENQEILK
ncbi:MULTISPECIES: DUF4430 domain-containing protein [Priestia]|jgi:hypothetical protein|nr:DUF4430 domain-containing protein [Priestia megaterium]MBZ5482994.1 DUF4430 domain-containing protein [Bacillus sp. T_4]PET68553.1 hypothetical protein CN533_25680 [Priestia megaterium]PFI66878.1 hypothetical protein COI68_06565 [Priestia megaterium]PFK84506.1 hypothetical protein COJ19_21390 [Priestia megaterium]PGK60190.1 hypothetical protein CN918_00540 [Priestia megaterium]